MVVPTHTPNADDEVKKAVDEPKITSSSSAQSRRPKTTCQRQATWRAVLRVSRPADGPQLERGGIDVRLMVTCAGVPLPGARAGKSSALSRRATSPCGVWRTTATCKCAGPSPPQLPTGATRVRVTADFAVLSFFRPEPRHIERLARRCLVDHLEVLRRQLEKGESQMPREPHRAVTSPRLRPGHASAA
jgi:hypothetical protein